MLVLSRKLGEEICLGQDIRLTVVDIRGHRVRLGISAPQSTPIRREELDQQPLESGPSNRLEIAPLSHVPHL